MSTQFKKTVEAVTLLESRLAAEQTQGSGTAIEWKASVDSIVTELTGLHEGIEKMKRKAQEPDPSKQASICSQRDISESVLC